MEVRWRLSAHTHGYARRVLLVSVPVVIEAAEPFDLASTGTGMGCPWASAVRAVISFSMRSRVDSVSAGTSSAVRPVVGMGSSTELC